MKIMKKQIIYSLLALTTVCLGACNNNDEIDTANSIFSTEPLERNAFDYWLLDNYTYSYNIDFMYRMKDIESDHKYNLVPADYDKAVALSKIIKHVWMDAYVELAGMDFLRVYVPKTFHLIGSRHGRRREENHPLQRERPQHKEDQYRKAQRVLF